MITSLLLGVLLSGPVQGQAQGQGQGQGQSQGQTTAPVVDANQLVSDMIAHYYNARTMSGTIVMTQVSGNKRAVCTTELQFAVPAKLYVRQSLQSAVDQQQWLVTSDGAYFTYDPPTGVEGKRLIEDCFQNNRQLTVQDIYVAASHSIYDRSTPLDLIIGRIEDLKYRKQQWVTLATLGTTKIGDTDVTVVGGDWREYGKAPVGATYQMMIDGQKQLRRFVMFQKIGTPINGRLVVQDVETDWDINVVKDGPVNDLLFKVIR